MSPCLGFVITPADFDSVKQIFSQNAKRPFKISFGNLSEGSQARNCHPITVSLPHIPQPYVFVEGSGLSFSADRSFLGLLEHCKLWTSPKAVYRPVEGFSTELETIRVVMCGSLAEGAFLFIAGEGAEEFSVSKLHHVSKITIGYWRDSSDLRLAQSALVFRMACGQASVDDLGRRVSTVLSKMVS